MRIRVLALAMFLVAVLAYGAGWKTYQAKMGRPETDAGKKVNYQLTGAEHELSRYQDVLFASFGTGKDPNKDLFLRDRDGVWNKLADKWAEASNLRVTQDVLGAILRQASEPPLTAHSDAEKDRDKTEHFRDAQLRIAALQVSQNARMIALLEKLANQKK